MSGAVCAAPILLWDCREDSFSCLVLSVLLLSLLGLWTGRLQLFVAVCAAPDSASTVGSTTSVVGAVSAAPILIWDCREDNFSCLKLSVLPLTLLGLWRGQIQLSGASGLCLP